jgi:hypothetical protein
MARFLTLSLVSSERFSIQVLTALPVYVFYARRIRILGGKLWLCVTLLIFGGIHFAAAVVICVKVLFDARVAALNEPHNMVCRLVTCDLT